MTFSKLHSQITFFLLGIVHAQASIVSTPFPGGVENQIIQTSSQPGWLHLLHYSKIPFYSPADDFSFWESEFDNRDFFLAPDGKKNPGSELKQTLVAFYTPPTSEEIQHKKQHALCKFPGRKIFLEPIFTPLLGPFPKIQCKNFENFKTSLAVKSVSVIFSTYYINNPSSAFGHSFLRLNRYPLNSQARSSELLDMGINYAAVVDSNNPFIYAFKGFFGFFPGTFTSVPYYYKVREYNDFESRDLWEYPLLLSSNEIELLVAHIWEVGETFLWYYYLSENCSYHVLSLLQAARPSSSLLRRQRQIVIPSDTLRTLSGSGQKLPQGEKPFLDGKHFRPSLWKSTAQKFEALSPDEKKIATHEMRRIKKSVRGSISISPELSSYLPIENKVHVLDFLLDAIDVYFSKEVLSPQSLASEIKYFYQAERASIAIQSAPKISNPARGHQITSHSLQTTADSSPDEGHPSRRLQIAPQIAGPGNYTTLVGYRFSLHDALDPQPGYPPATTLEMFHFSGRFSGSSRVWLEELTLFSVESLMPSSEIRNLLAAHTLSALSWKARFGWQRLYDNDCFETTCIGPRLTLGAGQAVQFAVSSDTKINSPIVFALIPEFSSQYSNHFHGSKWQFDLGLRSTVLWQKSWGGWRFDFSPYYRPFSEIQTLRFPFSIEARSKLTQSLSLGALLRWEMNKPDLNDSHPLSIKNSIYRRSPSQWEGSLSLYYYH